MKEFLEELEIALKIFKKPIEFKKYNDGSVELIGTGFVIDNKGCIFEAVKEDEEKYRFVLKDQLNIFNMEDSIKNILSLVSISFYIRQKDERYYQMLTDQFKV